jgi:hypothetical protein
MMSKRDASESSDDDWSNSGSDTEQMCFESAAPAPKRPCLDGAALALHSPRNFPEMSSRWSVIPAVGAAQLPLPMRPPLEALDVRLLTPEQPRRGSQTAPPFVGLPMPFIPVARATAVADERRTVAKPADAQRRPASSKKDRTEWTAWEDETINQSVAELGTRWRAIAARMPGRSDDAVRNRYARLRGLLPIRSTAPRARGGEPVRHGWSEAEDVIIAEAVSSSVGKRWAEIARMLPRQRTEHAIRNRWHRLQMAPNDGRDAGHIEGLA